MTLPQGQGRRICFKVEKGHFAKFFDNISYTIFIRVMNLSKNVAFAETFEMMSLRLTLTEGEGHNIN